MMLTRAKDREAAASVGQRLRLRRKIRGLSLQHVADRAGISIGLLSEIERGLASPSPQTLKRICGALEMPMQWLFDADGSAEEGPIVRAAARRRLDFGAKGIRKELMTPDAVPRIQMMRIVLSPGGGSSQLGLDGPEGAKCGTVLAGRFGLALGDREYALGPGDSFAFDARTPHRFWCIGNTECEVLWVVTPAVY